MPLGDQGGAAPQLILSCIADCDIEKGDPICLMPNYVVRNTGGRLSGQALKDAVKGEALPVLVRGVCRFEEGKFRVNLNIPGVPSKWHINKSEGILVPTRKGRSFEILYMSNTRLDVLI